MKPFFPEDILSTWFDREAEPHEQQEVLRRLESAEKGEKAATERELDELEILSAALQNLPQQPVPTELTKLILQQITNSAPVETSEAAVSNGIAGAHTQPLPMGPAPVKRRSRWLTGMLPVGICVLALIVMVKLLGTTPATTHSESPSLPALSNSGDRLEQDSLVAGDFDASNRQVNPHLSAWPLVRSFKNGVQQSDFTQPGNAPAGPLQNQFATKKMQMTGPEQMAQLPSQTFAEGLEHPGKPGTAHFFRLYEDPAQLEVGQIVDAIQQQGDEVVVIQLTVVDLNQGLEKLEVLLAQNNIPVRSTVDFADNYYRYREFDRDQQTADKGSEPGLSATQPAANEQEQETAAKKQELYNQQQQRADRKDAPVQLYAFYVETSGEQLQAALKDIQQQKMLDSLAVNSPETLLALTETNRQRVQALAFGSNPEAQKRWNDQVRTEKEAQEDYSPPQQPPVAPPETAPTPAVATAPGGVPKMADSQLDDVNPKSSEQRGHEKDPQEPKTSRNVNPPAEEPSTGISKAVPPTPVRMQTESKPGTEPPSNEKPATEEKTPQPAATPAPPRSFGETDPPPPPAPVNPDLETIRSKLPAQFKVPQERQPKSTEPVNDETPGLAPPANQLEDQTKESAEEKARKLASGKKRLQIVFMVVPAPIPPLVPGPAPPATNPAPGPR